MANASHLDVAFRLRFATGVVWVILFTPLTPSAAQTVIGSARVVCGAGLPDSEISGPIVGAIINQSNTTITDLEVELSIIGRKGQNVLVRARDSRFVVVPSLNQTGAVFKLQPNGDVYFTFPAATEMRAFSVNTPYVIRGDHTCAPTDRHVFWSPDVLNVAAIAEDAADVLPPSDPPLVPRKRCHSRE